MSTERQIEANRLNARKSTGPKTAKGRAAVRLNALKTGLTAKTLILPGESEAEFRGLLESLEIEHRPTTPEEQTLVIRSAMATWRLRRLFHNRSRLARQKYHVNLARTMNAAHQSLLDVGGPAGTGDQHHGARQFGRQRRGGEQFVEPAQDARRVD